MSTVLCEWDRVTQKKEEEKKPVLLPGTKNRINQESVQQHCSQSLVHYIHYHFDARASKDNVCFRNITE